MKISVADRLLALCSPPSLLFCLSLFTRPDQEYTVFLAVCGTQSRNTESNAISADGTFPSWGNVIDKKGCSAVHRPDLFGNNKTEVFPVQHKDALSLSEYLCQGFYLCNNVTPIT